MFARVAVLYAEPGDVYSILLDYVNNENYLEARYTSVSNGITMGLYSMMGGVETLLKECTVVGTNIIEQLSACVSEGIFSASLTDVITIEAPDISCDPESPCGYHGAIRHSNSHASFFTDWYITQLYDDNRAECPRCGFCTCQETPEDDVILLPQRLLLTIVMDDPEGCTSLDGQSIILTSISECTAQTIWEGSVEDLGSCLSPFLRQEGESGVNYRFHATLECASSLLEPGEMLKPANRILWLNDANGLYSAIRQECSGIEPNMRLLSTAESTCDPMLWVFEYEADIVCYNYGPYEVTYCNPDLNYESCCQCCNAHYDPVDPERPPNICHIKFKVIITEAPPL
jgi:hypothetical protein